ncbi:hypothetical protein BaRGS_00003611 [Batillaria attramentaria]|uniref:Uncharacterized protein n=1 Tax=Batillaria attramentaria TaxID=370345 RepID=A0ABD0M0M2_9CAEN
MVVCLSSYLPSRVANSVITGSIQLYFVTENTGLSPLELQNVHSAQHEVLQNLATFQSGSDNGGGRNILRAKGQKFPTPKTHYHNGGPVIFLKCVKIKALKAKSWAF